MTESKGSALVGQNVDLMSICWKSVYVNLQLACDEGQIRESERDVLDDPLLVSLDRVSF